MGLFEWLENFSRANERPSIRRPHAPDSPLVRRRFRFLGNVQGVGFRYEASLTAGALGLTGWARNESDGTVIVEVEGQEVCVYEFLRVMRAVPRFLVSEVQEETLAVSGTEKGFRTLY